jgi:FkbM family methyltransferase
MKKMVLALLYINIFMSSFLIKSKETIAILEMIIKPGSLIFDVGAHEGNKTADFIAHGARHVICFEPQPECVQKLRTRYKDKMNVTIEPIGLSYKDDKLVMFQATEATTISTFSEEWTKSSRFASHYTWDKQIEVKVTTLDKMIKKYGLPDYCKIDVENYEFEVLKGLSKPIPFLSFEFAVETLQNTYKSIRYLERLGYKKFNIGVAEHDAFWFDEWIDAHSFYKVLEDFTKEDWSSIVKLWGDIYASYQ